MEENNNPPNEELQNPQLPATQSPTINRKPRISIFVIAGILFLLIATVASAAYLLNADDMSQRGWKTYVNQKYGYSLQYPSTWTVTEAEGPEYVVFCESCSRGPSYEGTMSIMTTNKEEDIKYMKDSFEEDINNDVHYQVTKLKQINIANKGYLPLYRFKGIPGPLWSGTPPDNLQLESYIGKNYYSFSANPDEQDLFEQVLATFKLTN